MIRLQTWTLGCLAGLLACAVIPCAVWAQGFTTSEILSNDVAGAFAVDAADFDGDGDMDLALSRRFPASSVDWLENRGTGSALSHSIWTGADIRKIIAGEFTGDSRPDIVIASYDVSSGQFILARNNGQAPDYFETSSICATATGAYSVSSTDIDGDYDSDLVTAEYRGNVVRVFRNDPDGLLQIAAVRVMSPYDAHFSDLDSDGDLDVVGCSESLPLFWLDHQDTLWSYRDLGFARNCQAVAAGDLDDDGDTDIIAAPYTGSTVYWWERTLTGYTPHALSGTMRQASDIKIADLDLDGHQDIVASGQLGNFCWWKNNGDRIFSLRTIPAVGGAAYNKMTVVDYDLDGDPDLIVADAAPENPVVRLFRNTMGIPGFISGIVISADDGLPVRDAVVRLNETGSATRTDSLGRYRLSCAAGSYTVKISKSCWNPVQFDSVHTAEADTTLLNADLRHPAFELPTTSLNLMVQNHESQTIPIAIHNSGDGLLMLEAEVGGSPGPETWLAVTPQTAEAAAGDSITLSVTVAPDTLDSSNWDLYGWVRVTSNACPDTVQTIVVVAYVLDTPNRIPALPGRTALIGAYPNPFNGSTTVEFELAAPSTVELNLFDLLGRQVRHQRMQQNAGLQRMALDAEALPSGVYVLGVMLGSQLFSQKLLLIR